MAARDIVSSRLIVNGRPYIINLINNPTIDDVVMTESRVLAAEIENGVIEEGRRVSRDIRDFLIRLKVER